MTLPSTQSCTEPATMATVISRRAQDRPARYAVPAKLMLPPPSARRLTDGAEVAGRARAG